ncbi:MAG TPA: hypothetical protein VJP79_09795 [Nitrososphaera sp.]|nr:hypothetical protein [Nitrososphaera sp.]
MLLLDPSSVAAASSTSEIITGPPPPLPVAITLSDDVYYPGDILRIAGQVREIQQDQDYAHLVVYYPNNNDIYFRADANVLPNGSFTFQEELGGQKKTVSGVYSLEVRYGDAGANALFMMIAGPYDLKVDGRTYPIHYRISSALIDSVWVNQTENSLTIHLSNSTRRGELEITLPRQVIDSYIQDDDASSSTMHAEARFNVLISTSKFTDFHQAEFAQSKQNTTHRTLQIGIPYEESGQFSPEWFVKIIGTSVVPEMGANWLTGLTLAILLVVMTGSASYRRWNVL